MDVKTCVISLHQKQITKLIILGYLIIEFINKISNFFYRTQHQLTYISGVPSMQFDSEV